MSVLDPYDVTSRKVITIQNNALNTYEDISLKATNVNLEEKARDHQTEVHPLGTTNVCITFYSNPSQ